MPIRLRVDHRTRYDYEQPVSLSPHLVRLFPRTEPGRLVQALKFTTNDHASVQYRRDLFDNNFARCFYPDKTQNLFFDFALEIELHEQNAFDFLLDNFAANYPFAYPLGTTARLATYIAPPAGESPQTDPGKLLPLAFWTAPTEPTPTVSLLIDLLDTIHAHIRYELREEGEARPPLETLQLGSGSCRDTGVLLSAVLRELGLAARLASGYLCLFGSEARDRHAEGAMHLWTEVYLPGAGWVGLDPSNGVFCDHRYVTTAVGLTTADVTPTTGSYYSPVVVPAHMTATLNLTAL